MRRFLFTSPRYKGFVEAIYDNTDLIWKINFCNAIGINRDWRKAFCSRMPATVEGIEHVFGGVEEVKYKEVDFEVTFEDFKREYPNLRNTHLAIAYWYRMTKAEQYLAYLAAIEYRQYCERLNLEKRYIMLPEKFLKKEQWLNNWKSL
jgi:hypothetical protein